MFAIDQTRTDKRPKNLDGGIFLGVITGLRYYTPRLGRWISRDPIGENGGACLFAVVMNNPVRFIDAVGYGIQGLNWWYHLEQGMIELGLGEGWQVHGDRRVFPSPTDEQVTAYEETVQSNLKKEKCESLTDVGHTQQLAPPNLDAAFLGRAEVFGDSYTIGGPLVSPEVPFSAGLLVGLFVPMVQHTVTSRYGWEFDIVMTYKAETQHCICGTNGVPKWWTDPNARYSNVKMRMERRRNTVTVSQDYTKPSTTTPLQ